MRFIRKSEPPADYARFVDGVEDATHAAWRRLQRKRHRSAHRALWDALLTEQGHTCCYCGARVAHREEERALDAGHLEHLLPKAKHCFPEWKFAYDNLMVSCQGHLGTRPPREPSHCGVAKRDWPGRGTIDDFVSPLDPAVAQAFRYSSDGRITAAEGDRAEAARETIDRLNLNQPRLVAQRREAIDAWLPLIDSGRAMFPDAGVGEPAEPYLAALLDVLGRLGLGPRG